MIFLELEPSNPLAAFLAPLVTTIITVILFLLLNYKLYTTRRNEERAYGSLSKLFETIVIKRMESLCSFHIACRKVLENLHAPRHALHFTIDKAQTEKAIEVIDELYEKHRIEDIEPMSFYDKKLPEKIGAIMEAYYDDITLRVASCVGKKTTSKLSEIGEVTTFGTKYIRALANEIAMHNPASRFQMDGEFNKIHKIKKVKRVGTEES